MITYSMQYVFTCGCYTTLRASSEKEIGEMIEACEDSPCPECSGVVLALTPSSICEWKKTPSERFD
jgi:hypothetical protein